MMYQKKGRWLWSCEDAEYAAESGSNSSTVHLNTRFGALVSCNSKNQAITTFRTFDLEYLGARQALQEALWLKQMLSVI